MSYFHSKTHLLPNYFKKIGLGVILLGLIIKFLGEGLIKIVPNLSEHLYISLILLGFAFIGASKDKVEDELTMHIRLKAMFWAFFYIILFVIIQPLIELFNERESVFKAEIIVLQMLIAYLIMYYYQKRKG